MSGYIGKAGQFAVMAELALRGYNVAIPEIDIGDDIFVLNDRTKVASRIQIKTATGERHITPPRYKCSYKVRVAQVRSQCNPDHHYAFVGRCNGAWAFLVMPTSDLAATLFDVDNGWGTVTPNGIWQGLDLHFFDDGGAKTSSLPNARNLSRYRDDPWGAWPKLIG